MFWDAYSGDSGWEAVFFPWYMFSHYTKDFKDDDERQEFQAILGTDDRYGGEEEAKLLGVSCEFDIGAEDPLRFEVTLENLNWRRQCIRTQCQNDLNKFHQEFPSTAREAFVSTGRGVFPREQLNEMVLDAEKMSREVPSEGFHIPIQAYKEGRTKEKYIIEAQDDGELQVWQRPNKQRDYRIGLM